MSVTELFEKACVRGAQDVDLLREGERSSVKKKKKQESYVCVHHRGEGEEEAFDRQS